MATTMFLETTLRDKGGRGEPIDIELGRSSFYGESLMYLTVNDQTVILSAKDGQEFCGAVAELAAYLGYAGNR